MRWFSPPESRLRFVISYLGEERGPDRLDLIEASGLDECYKLVGL